MINLFEMFGPLVIDRSNSELRKRFLAYFKYFTQTNKYNIHVCFYFVSIKLAFVLKLTYKVLPFHHRSYD